MIKRFFRKGTDESSDVNREAVSSGGVTVLIVDDSPTEVHVLKKILEKHGYRTEVANDGQEGVAMAKRIRPSLILMDVVMPVLNGFQATRQLSKDQSTSAIPVIMVTTKDQETDKSWGMRQGATDYLVKPVAPAELITKIRNVLDR
ncbi:Response regulator receiver domain [endosymbiont of Ridgeia piscesae]|jgi:twitching motility two-component system response regulator PilH|uniref:Protein PilH n=3 Tax=sulfur-oxidizing symbionts TaxID=32036 RepID=G2FJD0_9GAMM|nr:protein PilH [endosymbiont of Tevnia jerichonana (vent Tica)]KRT56370.1 Response regulator receiver domain [endosymbiont of Ridgeia piscesae]